MRRERGKPAGMKLALALALVSSVSAFALDDESAGLDPRVTRLMREEQSTNQRFCASFAFEGGRASVVAMDCGFAIHDRFALSLRLATEGRPGAEEYERQVALPNTGLFCRELGEYAGVFTGPDCDAWNRERSALVLYAIGKPEPTFSERAEIERRIRSQKSLRIRMCQSLRSAGNRGRGDVFQSRIQSCLVSAAQAERTDRAILLREFPLD